jgi:hypothetical protein
VGDYIEKRILVVVKTYPNPSSTYGETVCCAGVDLETGRWVRLYPITFRSLADRQFEKFQEIRCRATRPRDDTRPESLRVDQDSIELIGDPIPAGPRGWIRRMAHLPQSARSLEDIREAQATDGTSLGMFRPKEILRVTKRKADPWDEKQRAYLQRQHLNLGAEVSRQLSELEQIPWTFSYEFVCDDERCVKPHSLSIIDWEIGAAYRNWSRTYGKDWEDKLREKFERELPASDLHLVVGNLNARHHVFVIVGLVRPPRPKMDGGYVQETLNLMGQQRAMASVRVGLETQEADPLGLEERHEPIELFPDEA